MIKAPMFANWGVSEGGALAMPPRLVKPYMEVSASCHTFIGCAREGRHLLNPSRLAFGDGVSFFGGLTGNGRKGRLVLGSVCPKRGSSSRSIANLELSSEEKVSNMVLKQAALINKHLRSRGLEAKPGIVVRGSDESLMEAYDCCRKIFAENSKSFYLGTQLMTPDRRKAIWAIYAWCRRTDDLVDDPNETCVTPAALESWEERLEDIFRGDPHDLLDAALLDTITRFPIDIQPFKDMIEGMRQDLTKSRYETFDELYLYSYYASGTVGLMTVPVIGIAVDSQATMDKVYSTAVILGIANQLTNILRDVGEDARRGRIYLPQDELAKAGLSDDDIFSGRVTDKWRDFMKSQIKRARMFFDEAERGIACFTGASWCPIWLALLLYRQILDEIEANNYDNFTRRAHVSKAKKLATLPIAYAKSLL
ncbi:hypothetical protein MLD38_001170 [Melastoma candidum]|uniref:Uncharacterized protein n=1 Tax=Melastoma candidum TaxID=119954 RepID=A0ACB9SDC2_9MYRT|nr:hypothetical protein MLD38_001170 [Melastoma candidum]